MRTRFLFVLAWCLWGWVTTAWGQEALPRVPPTEPADAVKTFRVRHGFQMDLLAAEPLTMDPVAIAYDGNGLAWVVEMSDYPYTDKSTDRPFQERLTDLPIGRVRILEDLDGDGRFDRSDILAGDLSWPTGIALFDGGAFVAATPDIWYLKDTDGDRRADVRKRIFTGFRKFNVQAVMNNLVWGVDHKIYGAGATNGGTIRKVDQPDAPAVTISRHDFRFDPATLEFEAISGGARFGNTFDDWGNRFVCNIRNPVQQVVLPSHYLARNPYFPVPSALHDVAEAGDTLPVYRTSPPEPWRITRARRWSAERDKSYPRSETAAEGYFTSSSGVTIYRGDAYPREYYNQVFVGEVAGNLIHRQSLAPTGVTFVSKRADENSEFVSSVDNWFRPVNFVNAPDGTLHVLDMYRETIEHPWSIPDDIKALVDLESGRDRGRIYRLSPPGFQVPKPPRLGSATTRELVTTLENPNSWWRETAHRLIFEQRDPAAVPWLRQMLRTSDVPLARMHSLWSLAGLNALNAEDTLVGLGDANGGVREHAVRLAEPHLKTSPALLQRVAAMVSDLDIRVRFQLAFTLGDVQDPLAASGLVALVRSDAADPWIRIALLSSLAEESGKVLLALLADSAFAADANLFPFQRQLAVVTAVRGRGQEVEPMLTALASLPESSATRALQINVLLGLGDGLKRVKRNIVDIAQANTPAARLIQRLLEHAADTVADTSLPLAARRNAVELLSLSSYATAKMPLTRLLVAREPQDIQLAAVRSLASFPDQDVVPALLGPWSSYTPVLRSEVVELLLTREDRIIPVLDAVSAGTVPISQVSSVRRALLLTHRDSTILARARALWGDDVPSARKDVIAKYQPALSLPSERPRGKLVFERECTGCHRLEGKGFDIGPSLTTIRHRTAEEVLTHILDPNREVGPDFVQYVIDMDDGRVATGVIASETATSITLRRAENVTEDILRTNIEKISNTGASLMPLGLEQKISVQEMADLLRYLLSS